MKNPIIKWAKDLNRHLSKEDLQRANRHTKGCSASQPSEMQIKITTRYYFTLVRIAIITNQHITSAGKDVEKREP